MVKSFRTVLFLSIFMVFLMPAMPADAIKFLKSKDKTPALQVAEASIALTIVDRVPRGVATVFANEVETLSCYSKIINGGAVGHDSVRHVWYYGDDIMADVKLRVGASSWRTHSTKTIMKHWIGDWHVDIIAPDDTVLKTLNFTIK